MDDCWVIAFPLVGLGGGGEGLVFQLVGFGDYVVVRFVVGCAFDWFPVGNFVHMFVYVFVGDSCELVV